MPGPFPFAALADETSLEPVAGGSETRRLIEDIARRMAAQRQGTQARPEDDPGMGRLMDRMLTPVRPPLAAPIGRPKGGHGGHYETEALDPGFEQLGVPSGAARAPFHGPYVPGRGFETYGHHPSENLQDWTGTPSGTMRRIRPEDY